jgi:hypothetical protein
VKNREKYAVIDRIVNGIATLLVGEEEKDMIVGLNRLPEGAKEGDWLEMDSEGSFAAAPGVTWERKKRVRSKLDKLRKK